MKQVRSVLVAALVALSASGVRIQEARALDLETVLREVSADNPELGARRAMVDAARRRIAPAGSWPSPMLMLGAMNVPASLRFDEEPMTMKTIGLTQRMPVFGRTGLARRSAREGLNEEAAATEMEYYMVFGMAWEAYASAYHAAQRVRVAEAHQSVMERLVGSARARYESGEGRLEDVLRAQAEQARTVADLAQFGAEERSARSRLDALRGKVVGGPPDTLAPPPSPRVPDDPAAWLAAVSASHPRLREFEARAARNRWAARAERRMAWPDLEVSVAYGIRQPLAATGAHQDNMWTATLGLMLPVFAARNELARGAEMDAMARAAESERRAEELGLSAEVTAVHAEAVAALRRVQLLADTVVVTQRRALEASWSAYGAGLTDLWRALEAAHTLYTEEVALANARQSLAHAEARFVSLTGRGDLLGVRLPRVDED